MSKQYERVTEPAYIQTHKWEYAPIKLDVSDWRTTSNGCIEERETYEIDNYDAVDLDQGARPRSRPGARPPTSAPSGRRNIPSLIFARSKKWDNTGGFTTKKVTRPKRSSSIPIRWAWRPARPRRASSRK